MKEEIKGNFDIITLGVIFNPEERTILIGKRAEKDEDIPELSWAFPGGRPYQGEELEKSLNREIKEETGIDVENLGSIFARIFPEKKDLIIIYYLCEKISGEEKLGDEFSELKWVAPEELEKHFTTSFDPRLKEYILNLKKKEK